VLNSIFSWKIAWQENGIRVWGYHNISSWLHFVKYRQCHVLWQKVLEGLTHHYEPLYPLVLVAYQTFFWEDILAYCETHEELLLLVCANLSKTNGTRGRIFEFLLIKHCSINANVTFLKGFSALKKCNLIETFPPKSSFPLIDTHSSNMLPEIMI